ncbi:MAG TPA: TRAP transporter substrate-binding protein DctP [Thermoleophilaceae bacterium]|nr:TRAP transporter substrate-binding protein DctP [Thermoleophilaceae bacterium]
MTCLRHTRTAFLATAMAAAVLAGCLGGEGGTKAGGGAGPLTLRVGTDDPPGRPGESQIEELAHQVEELSGGDIRIKPVLNAGGDSDWDQQVIRKVRGGDLDMAVVPSRAWDTEGVTSLRALNAPFLIASDELLAEVISGGLADDLMSGLDETGVVPLALFPEGLRHPFGFEAPLLGPGDYAGEEIRTPTSDTTAAVFELLGATTDDQEPDNAVQVGMESAYFLEPSGTATGNVTFYPKANALVAGGDMWKDLDDDQREVLEEAAAKTRERLIDTAPSDSEAARAYCADGGAVVLASDAQVAALEEATAPLYAELERDGLTRRIIDAIRGLERSTTVSAEAPKACGKPSAAEGGSTRSPAVDGVYRFEVTDEHLRRAGVTDPVKIDEDHGVYTMTLKRGKYCWTQRAPNPLNNPGDCDTYEIHGHRLVYHVPAKEPDVYRWRKTSDGDLDLTVLRTAPGELPYVKAWTTPSWQRIGDVGGSGE